MASTNEFARKILNSPTYAEPCLVYSAKKVLSPDNWYVILSAYPSIVFLIHSIGFS